MGRLTGRRGDRRGVSLILALFTTALLLTLSIAFIALAIGEARTSRRGGYAIVAQNAASWGVQFAINYMGRGSNLELDAPVGSVQPFLRLRGGGGQTSKFLTSTNNGSYFVTLSKVPNDPNLNAVRMSITNTATPDSKYAMVVGQGSDQLDVKVNVDVTPVLATYGTNQNSPFALTSRVAVYNSDGELLGNHVAQARVVMADEFTVENAAAWDAQGVGPGTNVMASKIYIPNNYQLSGPLYVTGYPSPTNPGNVNPNDPSSWKNSWYQSAGYLQFESPNPSPTPSANDPNYVRFSGPVKINQIANKGPDGNPINPNNLQQNFAGGADYTQPFYPFVGQNADMYFNSYSSKNPNGNYSTDLSNYAFGADPNGRGLFYAAAVAGVSKGGQSGYFPVTRADIQSAYDKSPPTPNLNSSTPVALQDYRPPIPQVEVLLKGDGSVTVNYWEVNKGDGGINDGNAGLLKSYSFNASALAAGTIYVGGGDTVVRSALKGNGSGTTQNFPGQITVVAATDPLREPTNLTARNNAAAELANEKANGQTTNLTTVPNATYANYSQSIYAQAAAAVFNEVKRRSGITVNGVPGVPATIPDPNNPGQQIQNPEFITQQQFVAQQLNPPYTPAKLNSLAKEFNVPVDTSQLTKGDLYWPPPAPNVEREGNMVIAGDVTTASNGKSVVGLYAKNFILLNDRTANIKKNNVLKVDASLMSFDHSVQLDWDNTGRNNVTGAYNKIMSPGYDGTFELNGVIHSKYSDVEGSTKKQGYYNQKIVYNPALKYNSAPTQPVFNPADMPADRISIPWEITQYTDKGAIDTVTTSSPTP